MASTVARPLSTLPMTMSLPSNRGTGPGPVVMRNLVIGAVGETSSPSSTLNARLNVPGRLCVSLKAAALAVSGLLVAKEGATSTW